MLIRRQSFQTGSIGDPLAFLGYFGGLQALLNGSGLFDCLTAEVVQESIEGTKPPIKDGQDGGPHG